VCSVAWSPAATRATGDVCRPCREGCVIVFVRGNEGVFVDGLLRRWSTAGVEFGGMLLCVRTLPSKRLLRCGSRRAWCRAISAISRLSQSVMYFSTSQTFAFYSAQDADVTHADPVLHTLFPSWPRDPSPRRLRLCNLQGCVCCTTPQTSSSLHASFRRQIMAGTGVTDITARQHFGPYPLASLLQRRPRPGHFCTLI
jgi:hypothetical protein